MSFIIEARSSPLSKPAYQITIIRTTEIAVVQAYGIRRL